MGRQLLRAMEVQCTADACALSCTTDREQAEKLHQPSHVHVVWPKGFGLGLKVPLNYWEGHLAFGAKES